MKAVFALGTLTVVLAVPVIASKQEGASSSTFPVGVVPAERPQQGEGPFNPPSPEPVAEGPFNPPSPAPVAEGPFNPPSPAA